MQYMEIVDTAVLRRASKKYPHLGAWLETWKRITEAAHWQSIQDVRKDFPSADGVKLKTGTVVTVFNVKGNDYRLLTSIVYSTGWVYVWELLTHAEYNKNQWKVRL